MENPYWPLFDLRIATSQVEIRVATDDDLIVLAELASRGVHDPTLMPFLQAWTDEPSPAMERGLLQWCWRHRANWTPSEWILTGVVTVKGEIVGVQDLMASNFAKLRVVKTGSWLGMAHQGKGIGKAMRAAMLHFAFEGLHAVEANSGGWIDNHSSLGVSRALGYEENGRRRALRRNEPAELIELRLLRSRWEKTARPEVTISGLERCLDFFVEASS